MDAKLIEVLLAEDNDDDIVLIEEAFSDARLANPIKIVRDGEEAMTYLRRRGKYSDAEIPGLVLLDINMPMKNGFQVLKELKTDVNLRRIPVIILTSSDREEDVVKSYEEGACTYIRKPVNFDQMKIIVKQFSLYWGLVARLPVVH